MKQAVEARRWTAGRLNVSHVNSRSNKIAAFHSGPHTNPKEDEISKETIADTTLPSRVLQWKHFETALSEISPSSTEDGTLPELRKVCHADTMLGSRSVLTILVGRAIWRWRVETRSTKGLWQIVRIQQCGQDRKRGLRKSQDGIDTVDSVDSPAEMRSDSGHSVNPLFPGGG